MSELFVPMYSDGSFAVGGGSSTQSHVRAFQTKTSAERSAARLPISSYSYNRETRKYDIHEQGTPKVVRFVSEDVVAGLKVAIASHIWDQPALGREINDLIDRELG